MESARKTYLAAQSQMMYTANMVYSITCVGLMALEQYTLLETTDPIFAQILSIMTIGIAILFSLLAMLAVEIIYQDELMNIPLVKYLGRLTPELTLVERYGFLSTSVVRQIVSTVSLFAFWIAFGGTSRGGSLAMGMALITVITAYGISHLKDIATQQPTQPLNDTTDGMTDRIMSS